MTIEPSRSRSRRRALLLTSLIAISGVGCDEAAVSEDSTFRQRRYSPFVDLPRLSGGAKMVLCLGLNDVIAARDIGDITQTQYTSLRNNIVRAAQKWSDEHLLLRYRFVVEDDYRDCPADPWGRAHSIDIKIQDTHNPDHDIINVDDLGVGTEPEIEYVQNGRTYVDPGSPITLATRLLTMSDPEVVHTVMHEVGHSMGLAHTGTNEGIKVDLTPDQDPNSIMNPFVSNSVDWSCWDRTALTVLFGIHS